MPEIEMKCSTCGATSPSENEYCSNGFHAQGPTYWPGEDELVSNLRSLAPFLEAHHCSSASVTEAADRIETLEAEVARLSQVR
jgi:hypothetical protein